MNLINIAKGWYHYIKATESTRQLMERRLDVCDKCPCKAQINGIGKVLLQQLNDPNNLYQCNLCHCPLGTLASLPTPACKAHKWDNL